MAVILTIGLALGEGGQPGHALDRYANVRLVYQGIGQLRGLTSLLLDNPPVSFNTDLSGLKRNGDGYYLLDGVMGCLQRAIDAYDGLLETYSGENAESDSAA